MKITRISCHALDATYAALARMPRKFIVVLVETDAGITGIGDATNWPIGAHLPQIVCEIGRGLIGRDPLEIERLWQEMYRGANYVGRAGLAVTALSGLEIALWDIAGKSLGVPVYQLLGGAVRDDVEVYANYWTLGVPRDPQAFADAARATIAAGFRGLKFYALDAPPAGDPLRRTLTRPKLNEIVRIVAAVREAVGPEVELYVECGGKLDYYTALRLLNDLAEFDIGFVEEPIPPENMETMARLAAHSRIPLASGERLYTAYEFRRLLELQAVAVVQPDVVRTGGLLECKKIAALAETYFTPVAPHNANSPISTMATLHFAVSTPNFMTLEYFVQDVPWRDAFMTPAIQVRNGRIARPTGPGLGITLDPDLLRRHSESVAEVH
jgi:galactonate dehydratase